MTALDELAIVPYALEHRASIAHLLTAIGWEQRYIAGQLAAIDALASDRANARVWIACQNAVGVGYLTLQFYAWNRLAQIHGLAVLPALRHRGIAARLVQQAEAFVRERGGRGVYVDTPVTNTGARAFYVAQQYQQDYVMTAYYDDGLDGVTYLKLFDSAPREPI